MSGIAGIIHLDGAPVEPGLVEGMTAAMAHRGPDGIRHWVAGSVALGHAMLYTTPESLQERQPLASEDERLVLAMDGRVDNWEGLRRELQGRGTVLRDRSDAELVLQAYEIWGTECLSHVEGDFALVLWDARRRVAFCARDRLGSKPLFYHWDGKTLSFASELHAILALPWVEPKLDQGVLAEYLATDWYSTEATLWRGVLRLGWAHQMLVDRQGPRPRRYWQPDFERALPFRRDEEYVEAYRELVFDAVRRMSRSHAPVAYEVSGGLDSSAVFCVAERLRRSGQLPAPAVEGYTLSFPDDPDANELEYARAVGAHVGVQIHEVMPTVAPLSTYREWARLYRDFPGYPNGMMSWDLSRLAQQRGCRVMLGGVGGDEWAGSSGQRAYYVEELASGRLDQLAGCFLADCRDLGIPSAAWWLLRSGLVPLLPPSVRQLLRSARRRLRPGSGQQQAAGGWLTAPLRDELAARRSVAPDPAPVPARRRGQLRQHGMLGHGYHRLAYELTERMASLAGLESRQPLKDPRLVELSIATPERLRMRGATDKYLHVRAMHAVLPELVLARRTKAEFSVVFRTHLEQMQELLTREIAERRAFWVEPEGVRRTYERYRERLATSRGSSGGMAQWALWTLFGCDAMLLGSR